MKERVLFAAALLCALPLTVSAAPVLPTTLLGSWIQPGKGEYGEMSVHVHGYQSQTLTGIIEIRGSKDCPQPIAFLGIIQSNKVLITSTESRVCGYGGRLEGEVMREDEGVYGGSFRYTYTILGFTLTWASGLFRLMPLEKTE